MVIRIPGITAATNNFPMDTSACEPYTIISRLGGISIPRIAEPEIVPSAIFRLYLSLSICGRAIFVNTAAEATVTPVMAANMALATTVAIPTPPRTLLSSRLAAS